MGLLLRTVARASQPVKGTAFHIYLYTADTENTGFLYPGVRMDVESRATPISTFHGT